MEFRGSAAAPEARTMPSLQRRRPRGSVPHGLSFGGFALLLVVVAALPQTTQSAQSLRGWGTARIRGLRNLPGNASTGPCAELNFRPTRLPEHVIPTEYRLELDLMLEPPFRAEGRVEIDLNVVNETRCIALHSVDTTISSVIEKDSDMPGTLVELDPPRPDGEVLYEFPSSLAIPETTLVIEYNTTIQANESSGFYRRAYTDGSGNERWLIGTQMEPFGARRALPCMDEPDKKVEVQLNLTTPSDVTALSNMPEVASEIVPDSPEKTKHVYMKTPKMSIYLLAFVIGDLQNVTRIIETAEGPKPLSLWMSTERNFSSNVDTILDVFADSYTYFEALFDEPYSLPKLDWVGIPGFPFGAMENWGLIISRESILFNSKTDADSGDLLRSWHIIPHEMAHKWFGNIITMKWWGELFLNEGFATYFEEVGAEHALPEDAFDKRVFVRTTMPALEVAQEPWWSQSVVTQGSDFPSYCGGFSGAAYQTNYKKGGSILRMIRAFLGDGAMNVTSVNGKEIPNDPAIRSFRQYLEQNKFGNVEIEDLWGAFDNVTGLPVSEWMEPWSFRPWYPLVEAELSESMDLEVFVKQRQFDLAGGTDCNATNSWWIPISYMTKASPEMKWTVLEGCEPMKLTTLVDENDLVVINPQRLGLYRVKYGPELQGRLILAAGTRKNESTDFEIDSVDLGGMLDDAFSLARAGLEDIDVFLELTAALGSRFEISYTPWAASLPHLLQIRDLLKQDDDFNDCATALEEYVRTKLTGPMISFTENPYAWSNGLPYFVGVNESLDFRLMHHFILQKAGEFGDEIVLQRALDLFWSGLIPNPDIRAVVYKLAVLAGTSAEYDAVKEKFLMEKSILERDRLISALTYTKDPELVNDTFHFALSDDVPRVDKGRVIGIPIDGSFEFVKNNLDTLLDQFGECSVIQWTQRIAEGRAGETASQEFETFFDSNDKLHPIPYKEASMTLPMFNQRWLEQHGDSTCEWLDSQLS